MWCLRELVGVGIGTYGVDGRDAVEERPVDFI
jgi:hypothetical protein